MSKKLIIQGCGNSAGVPAIGNFWGKCDPENPKNRRTRASAAVLSDKTTLIIDTGPDFKEQYNRLNLEHKIENGPDAILYTHEHGDHAHGIDEMRTLQRIYKRSFQAFANESTLELLQTRFYYMFQDSGNGFYKKVLEPTMLEYGRTYSVGDIEFIPFEMDHGTCMATGYRFGNIAYATDMHHMERESLEMLQGIDILIADGSAYIYDDNPVHASINRVVEMNEVIGARAVYLTSLSPMMDYEGLVSELPEGLYPAYDGQEFEIKYE